MNEKTKMSYFYLLSEFEEKDLIIQEINKNPTSKEKELIYQINKYVKLVKPYHYSVLSILSIKKFADETKRKNYLEHFIRIFDLREVDMNYVKICTDIKCLEFVYFLFYKYSLNKN